MPTDAAIVIDDIDLIIDRLGTLDIRAEQNRVFRCTLQADINAGHLDVLEIGFGVSEKLAAIFIQCSVHRFVVIYQKTNVKATGILDKGVGAGKALVSAAGV